MTSLTLMTWNVRYFGHGLGGLRATEGWMRLAARAIAQLDPLPDVVALQEVETASLRGGLGPRPQIQRFLDHLDAALDDHGLDTRFMGLHFPAHRYALPRVPPLYTTGLAVLVRDTVEVVAHNADDPHDITHVRLARFARFKQRRIAAHVRLRARGGDEEVDLFNTHLSLPAFLEVGPTRVPRKMGHGTNQLKEAFRVLEFLELKRGEHAVVLGDFNSAPDSPVYNAFTDRGLIDAHRQGGDENPDEHASARFLNQRMHIDHVFSTPSVHWQDFHAHRIDENGPFWGLSDHAPKVGRLEVSSGS